MSAPVVEWVVSRPTGADRERWRELYGAYARFYRAAPGPAVLDRLWSALLDPNRDDLDCLLARDDAGVAVGLAHVRPFHRTLEGATGCFLDDLFVAPECRSRGAATALLAAVRSLAAARGWGVVRWMTAEDNYRARACYDRVARRTGWVVYDMAPT